MQAEVDSLRLETSILTILTGEGMTGKSRLDDWTACGGKENGTFSWKVKQQLPDETDKAARMRQEHAFERCMIRSGYRYTGNCSSAYMKVSPLCDAP